MTESAPNRSPAAVVADASLDEKAGLTSGLDFWFTKPVPDLHLPYSSQVCTCSRSRPRYGGVDARIGRTLGFGIDEEEISRCSALPTSKRQ